MRKCHLHNSRTAIPRVDEIYLKVFSTAITKASPHSHSKFCFSSTSCLTAQHSFVYSASLISYACPSFALVLKLGQDAREEEGREEEGTGGGAI